jgi:glucose-6-phosphate isomerase
MFACLLEPATAIHQSAAWAALREQAAALEGHHLRELIVDKERCAALTAEHGAILLDYSRQRVTNETMDMLFNLAEVLLAITCCSHS